MATHRSEHGTRIFEGEDLPALLAEVMEAMGEEAAIVSARKVRTGGLAGFFSRERYQVVVRPGQAPATPVPVPAAAAAGAASAPPVPAPAPDHLDALLALADAVSERERPAGPSFGEVLARAAAAPEVIDLADRPPPVPPSAPDGLLHRRGSGPAGARPRPVLSRPAMTRPARPEPARADPAPEPPRPEIVVAHTRSGRRLARLRPAFVEVPRLTRAEAAAANSAVAAQARRRADERVLVDDAEPRPPQAPASPAPASPAGPEASDAIEAPELPWMPVPAFGTRTVLAVVGDTSALAAARRIAADGGLDPAEVIVAAAERPSDVRAWNWVRSPAEAARRRGLWATRPGAVVVAVVAPPTPPGVSFAEMVLEALVPGHVRLVISADLAAWSTIAGRADAVELA